MKRKGKMNLTTMRNKMGIFNWLSSKDEHAERIAKIFSWDEESMRRLNKEELDTEFRFLSANFTRTQEQAAQILEVMKESGWDTPTDTALYKAMSDGVQKSTEREMEVPFEAPSGILRGRGPSRALVAFVGASPSKLDEVRKKVFSGPIAKTVRDTYLSEFSLSEDNVYMTNLVPEYLSDEDGNPREPTTEEIQKWSENFSREMDEVKPMFVVALGKTAANAIENADEWLPHPRAIEIHGDSGEVSRKMSRLKDKVDKFVEENANKTHARIIKSDEEKRIVYGVVLEPEELDTDENWTNDEEIERVAHSWLLDSRVIGHEHVYKLEGVDVVESYIAPADFELNNETVKKGTWVLGVKVNDDDRWDMVKSGEYTGFSLGGFASIDESNTL